MRECLKQLLKDFVQYMLENPAELSFGEQYENSPLFTAATREEGMRIAEPIGDLFRRAREQNLLKEMPVEMLSALMSGAVISLAKLYLSGSVEFDEVSLAVGIDAIWDMIRR